MVPPKWSRNFRILWKHEVQWGVFQSLRLLPTSDEPGPCPPIRLISDPSQYFLIFYLFQNSGVKLNHLWIINYKACVRSRPSPNWVGCSWFCLQGLVKTKRELHTGQQTFSPRFEYANSRKRSCCCCSDVFFSDSIPFCTDQDGQYLFLKNICTYSIRIYIYKILYIFLHVSAANRCHQGVYTQMAGVYTQLTGIHTQMAGVYTQMTGVYTQMAGVYTQLTGVYTQMVGVYTQKYLKDTFVCIFSDNGWWKPKKLWRIEKLYLSVHRMCK